VEALMATSRRTVVWGLLLTAVVTITACGSTPLKEWEATWAETLTGIPPMEEMQQLDGAAGRAACDTALAALRSAAPVLTDAPDPDLAREVVIFIDFAESVFFECPIESDAHAGWEAGYAEMDQLRNAVTTVLAQLD
jgi:hypothetical protein